MLVSGTVIGAITQHFTGPFTSTAGDALSSMADNRLMFVLLSLGVGVIAPIVEEVCFRGLLWGSLAKRGMNPWWATAISALIFALFHFEPVRLPLLFATGLILGFLRQRTGRLGAGMLAHMINNSAALLAFASWPAPAAAAEVALPPFYAAATRLKPVPGASMNTRSLASSRL